MGCGGGWKGRRGEEGVVERMLFDRGGRCEDGGQRVSRQAHITSATTPTSPFSLTSAHIRHLPYDGRPPTHPPQLRTLCEEHPQQFSMNQLEDAVKAALRHGARDDRGAAVRQGGRLWARFSYCGLVHFRVRVMSRGSQWVIN